MSNSKESNETDRQSLQSETAPPSQESNITNCNPSTSISRDERHPLMDQTIAIDNNTLTSIINSIIQPPPTTTKINDRNNNNKNDTINSKVDSNANLNGNKQEKNENNNQNQSQQSYLLPVDLLITMDKQTNKPTVQAALPSTFAFQQPMTLPFLPSIPMSLASIPTTPATTINTAAGVSYQAPLTPQMPLMSMPMPSIPMSLLSQPQILPTQQLLHQHQQQQQQQQQPQKQINNHFNLNQLNQLNQANQLHQGYGSTLNPSAASFTPSTTYSAFGQAMNVITPISEHCNEEKVREQDECINEEQDAWYMIDAKQEKTKNINTRISGNSYKPPIPKHNNNQTMDHLNSTLNNEQTTDKPPPTPSHSSTHMMSPSFHRKKTWRNNGHEINEDTRKYGKSWRNFGNKREIVTPPRWRNNNNDNLHLNLSYHSRKPYDVFQPKPIKLLVEFVKHVTLPNRENYPPNKVMTKTWAMKNCGQHEWGCDVLLVYCKGDENLSLHDRYPVTNAQPGETVEISASIKTSNIPGRYCTYFRLQKNGRFFGPRVWVDIIVSGTTNTDAFDSRVPMQCAKDVKVSPKSSKWIKKKYSAIVACK